MVQGLGYGPVLKLLSSRTYWRRQTRAFILDERRTLDLVPITGTRGRGLHEDFQAKPFRDTPGLRRLCLEFPGRMYLQVYANDAVLNLSVSLPASAAAPFQFHLHPVAESPFETHAILQWFVITLRMKLTYFLQPPIPAYAGFCLCLSPCSVHSLTNTAQLQRSLLVPWCFQHVSCLSLLPFLPSACHAVWVALLSINPSSPVDISKDASSPNSPFGVVSLTESQPFSFSLLS